MAVAALPVQTPLSTQSWWTVESLSALRLLGLKPPSADGRFRVIANHILAGPSYSSPHGHLLEAFWRASRALSAPDALAIISEHRDWRRDLCVRTRAGDWKPLHSVLMPGAIVPGDGTRDDGVTVGSDFHEPDRELLSSVGVANLPFVGCCWGSTSHSECGHYLALCAVGYYRWGHSNPRYSGPNPWDTGRTA